jgi:hypothetical protein
MIILAAMLASGQVLPLLDRSWLNNQVRLEAAVSKNLKRTLKPMLPLAPNTFRKLMSYENTIGM